MESSVIVADPQYHDREPFARVLRQMGFTVFTAVKASEVKEIIQKEAVSHAFLERSIATPGLISDLADKVSVIYFASNPDWEETKEALLSGAIQVLKKPISESDIAELFKEIANKSRKKLREKAKKTIKNKGKISVNISKKDIIGEDPEFIKVLDLVDDISDIDSTVLITGETGTGKEVIAKLIHAQSPRNDSKFVAVNCGAIPDNLLESELFGHIKGAFTGAIADKPGVFDIADGGTVFLDEIGEMSPNLQVKLLRIIQERQYTAVGDVTQKYADVRIIAATNINLREAIKTKQFREDLYYRLNVIPIQLPPLRKRQFDIPLLLEHFKNKFCRLTGRKVTGFDEETTDILRNYSWPGNIRELENLVERLVVLKREGEITIEDLPYYIINEHTESLNQFPMSLPKEGVNLKETLDELEDNMIIQALTMTGGNRNKAAGLLKMNRTTLVEKLRKKKHLLDKLNQ